LCETVVYPREYAKKDEVLPIRVKALETSFLALSDGEKQDVVKALQSVVGTEKKFFEFLPVHLKSRLFKD